MTQLKNLALATFAALALLGLAPALQAGEAEEIMAKTDKAMLPAKDQVAVMKMTIKDKGGNTKVRQMLTKQLGSSMRLIRFQSPAEVKGVCFLARGDDEMYIYMPEFGKVRRIASHTKNESFMGSDFSYDDIGSTETASKNTGKVIKKEGDLVTLEVVPKDPESEAKRSILVVDTRYYLVVKSEQYDKNDKLFKTMTQEEIRQVSGYWLAHRITMQNVREGSSTTLEFSETSFNTGLKEDDFSQRNMKRGS